MSFAGFAPGVFCNYNVGMKVKTPRKMSTKKPQRRKSTGGLTTKLIRIGNSRGVRLPKAVIEQAGITNGVEIAVRGDEVVLRPLSSKKNPRAGWEAAFKKALAELPPDFLEREREEWADWQNMPNEFDEKEWTW
jgi:antitoxin MazE